MSGEKCKYCGGEIGYIGMPYGFTCLNRNCITHNDKEFIQELKQQLQTAKEENEKLTQQNKQMRGLISEINSEYSDDGILSKATKYTIQQTLKGGE